MVPSPRKRGRPAGSKNAPREQTPEVSAPLHIWTPEQVGAVLDIPFKLGQAQYPDHEQWERALEQAKLSYPTFAECLTVLVQFNPVYILLGIAIVQYGSALGSAVAESRSREKKKALEDGATPKD